jgi:hypothetical protein
MAHPVAALWAMIGYVAWTFVVLTLILLARLMMMLREGKKMNEFPGGVQHGSARYWRLYRAHMNLIENLPIVLPSLWLFYAFATPSGFWAAERMRRRNAVPRRAQPDGDVRCS